MPGFGDTGIANIEKPTPENLIKALELIRDISKRSAVGDLKDSIKSPVLQDFFGRNYQITEHAIERLKLLEKYEKNSFRVPYTESERGWKTEHWYRYFDTLPEAKEALEKDKSPGGATPNYYCIANGPIERFDIENKEWKRI